MKILKSILKWFGALLLFVLLCLTAIYLTLDISRLTPSLEAILEHHSGADVKIKGLRWSGLNAVSFDQMQLTWPLSPEEELAWEAYRAAKRAKKNDESVELPPRPLPALSLCATDIGASVELLPLLQNESAKLSLDGLILSCLDSPGSLVEGAPRRLQLQISAQHAGGVFGPLPKTGFELKLKGELSELPSGDIPLLMERLPLKASGTLSASFDLTLPMTRRMTLQQRRGDGALTIELSGLRNEKGLIGMFEVPKMNLGDLRAKIDVKQGTLHFNEFTIRSPDLSGELTGSVGIRSKLSRLAIKSHVSLDLSPEFVKNTPDIKQIALLQRRYFKEQNGGYHVGVELRGPLSRLRPSAREYSPYSKEGRAQQRERRTSARAAPTRPRAASTRAQAKRASRPKVGARPKRREPVRRRPVRETKPNRSSRRAERAARRRAKSKTAEPLGPINDEALEDEREPGADEELDEGEGLEAGQREDSNAAGDEVGEAEGEAEDDEKIAGEESEEGD